MDTRFERCKLSTVLSRGAALALALCLSALPMLAAQNTEDSPSESREEAPPDRPAYEGVPQTLDIAAGTVVSVRTSQYLSSDQNRPGDSFSAELAQPLVVDGWVVARRGQTVLGRVIVAQKAGRIKGVSRLGVELSHLVLVDGQQVPIRTEWMQSSGGKAHGQEATAVGSAAGMGAIIGAAADGGKGAAIGGAAGAGAGLAGVLLTRGRPSVIPEETLLTFQLESPVTISTVRGYVAFRPVSPEDHEGGRTLERRRENLAVRPSAPPPPYGGGYFPGPHVIGVYHIGGRRHGRW